MQAGSDGRVKMSGIKQLFFTVCIIFSMNALVLVEALPNEAREGCSIQHTVALATLRQSIGASRGWQQIGKALKLK